jgi:transposase-like protein
VDSQFFVVLDRVGSVTVAAAELGLNRMTCYQWARKAGVPRKTAGKRPPFNRKYAPEEEDRFFAVLDRVGSVAAAALREGRLAVLVGVGVSLGLLEIVATSVRGRIRHAGLSVSYCRVAALSRSQLSLMLISSMLPSCAGQAETPGARK